METNFSKYIVTHGGYVKPLEIPVEMSEGLGLCNPSVFIDNDGKILCNIRRVNYLFHQSLSYHWSSAYGPTNYHHPDNDVNLRTENYMCELDDNLEIKDGSLKHINYMPYEPKWHFTGEEDVRIVRWDGKLFVTGCRRDTEDTGISRMELTELDGNMNEMSRTRVPAPEKNDTYCEKNWMAILDKPYQYVKWCNPLQIVEYDTETKTTKEVLLKDQKIESEDALGDIRGSSQVIKVDNYYVALVHEVNLWTNRYSERAAIYYTRFIVWDENWDTVKLSQRFWFMNIPIEFTNGLAFDGKDFIIPFSVYDNAAFIARLSKEAVFQFIGIGDNYVETNNVSLQNNIYKYIMDIFNPERSYELGMEYFNKKQYSCAHAFFLKSAEQSSSDKMKYKRIGYDAYFMCQKCLESVGGRLDKLKHQYNLLIQWDPYRYEAYYELSRTYYGANENLNDHLTALGLASSAIAMLQDAKPLRLSNMDTKYMLDRVWFQYGICCYRSYKDYEAVPVLKDLLMNGHEIIRKQIESLGLNLE
jgi:predicted GH43/DUF377 family glycosyl hydrolase